MGAMLSKPNTHFRTRRDTRKRIIYKILGFPDGKSQTTKHKPHNSMDHFGGKHRTRKILNLR